VAHGLLILIRAKELRLPSMRGIITSRDVVQHVGIIYREFGFRCLARCLWVLATGRRTTFLDVVSCH
jgi:hypothetical protein